MRKLAWLALVACGVDAETSQSVNQAPPPALLEVSSVVLGDAMDVTVRGADPGDMVWIGASLRGPGSGPCPPNLGGLCLDLLNPVPIQSTRANRNGVAAFTLTVPNALPSDQIWFQAVGVGPTGAYATSVARRTVYDEPVMSIEMCNPAQMVDDPYSTNGIAITGDLLEVDLSYSGGCADHEFTACWNGAVAQSFPPQVFFDLVHDSNGDLCEAWLTETLRFDLGPVLTPPTLVHIAGESELYDP